MAKHSQGSKSLRTLISLKIAGKRWVRAELKAETAKARYREAYANRYGEEYRNPDWWLDV